MNNEINRLKRHPSSSHSRIQEWIRKDEINEAYEFDSTYDGTIGKEALIFREAMHNYHDDARIELGSDFNERKLIRKIHKALLGDAKDKLAADNAARRDHSFSNFIKWFDKSFQLKTLRQDIYDELKSWEIKPDDPNLKIVDNYIKVLKLLKQTESISSHDVINATQLSVGDQVTTLTQAIQRAKPKLYSFIDGFIMDYKYARGPKDLTELKTVIERGVQALASSKIHSNASNSNKTKNKSDLQMVNAINLDQFPQFSNVPNNSDANNNKYNSNNNNINNQYGPQRGRYRGTNRGSSHIQYTSQRGGYQGTNRGNYNQFSNFRNGYRGKNSRGGYRGRGRGRGSYRGRYSRGGYRGRGGNQYRGKSKSSPSYPPMYIPGYCKNTNCGKWGHRIVDCPTIHQPECKSLLESYMSFHPKDKPSVKLPGMINTTQFSPPSDPKSTQDVTSHLFSSSH